MLYFEAIHPPKTTVRKGLETIDEVIYDIPFHEHKQRFKIAAYY